MPVGVTVRPDPVPACPETAELGIGRRPFDLSHNAIAVAGPWREGQQAGMADSALSPRASSTSSTFAKASRHCDLCSCFQRLAAGIGLIIQAVVADTGSAAVIGGDNLEILMSPVLATLGTAAGGTLLRLVFRQVIESLGDRRMERVAVARQRENRHIG
jgi:hypothetical protein